MNTILFETANNIDLSQISNCEIDKLKLIVANLKTEHDIGAGIEYLLSKYDLTTKTFLKKDIVENYRNRFINATIGKGKMYLSNENVPNNKEKNTQVLYLYVENLENNKYEIKTTTDVKELAFVNYNSVNKITSHEEEFQLLYKLMITYGVANVRGARYKSWKLSLNDANDLIKTIMYLNNDMLVINKNNIPDQTVIETFMLRTNGFTVEEIAEMKSMLPSTIKFHLEKSVKYELKLEKQNLNDYDNIEEENIEKENIEEENYSENDINFNNEN